MYGLLLQSAADHLRSKYGEATWEKIRKAANISLNGFGTHSIYSETLMVDMANAASQITGDTVDTIMDSFGVEFVNFVGQFGYDRILKVLGRHMRDFLNGLDNLHEYLRFSYPKLKPPSFFVEDETKNGLTLTYRSRRRGFLHYVKGQIRQVGKVFYHTRVDIFVMANNYINLTQTTHVKFRLLFDNKAFREVSNHVVDNIVDSIPLRPELLFELFPFHIVFGRKMEIRSVGPGLRAVLPAAVGKSLIDLFILERPLTNFTWEDILHHTNNVFQLIGREPLTRSVDVIDAAEQSQEWRDTGGSAEGEDKAEQSNQEGLTNSILHLKGQMMYMNEWDSIMFLGTPIMSSLDDMFKIGLYINDLSMHDSSRDLVLAGTQQSAELKLALDQEQEKSRLLEQSMIKLDQEMQRTDALLYQMIPKPVADRLRKGVPSVETCQVFENVTILFSDVVGFTTICSQITPMEVVSMLNAMYTQFDQLSERHSVYKVETIGDAYMAVSGAPTVTPFHALHMCDMALDMKASTNSLLNPSNNETMKIRIGVHTGTTVAGVVGIKMPRYCLFGDTVNTASRMETSGEAMKIHVSETTKAELDGYPYEVQERGSIEVKGKGKMKTYWLVERKPISDEDLPKYPFIALMEEEVRNRNRDEQIENNNSRLNMDSGQILSGSPVPYSPVSYKDIFEERGSPVGRKYSRGSRGSADGEALRLGATITPRGSRASLPGCPFAMGLLGGSFSSDSFYKSSDKCPIAKKNSIDITYSSVFNDKNKVSNPATSFSTPPFNKEVVSDPTSGTDFESGSDTHNLNRATYTCPFSTSSYTSQNAVPQPHQMFSPRQHGDIHPNLLSSSKKLSGETGRSTPDPSVKVRFADTFATSADLSGHNESCSHATLNQESMSPFQNNNCTDNVSASTLSMHSVSVTTVSREDLSLPSLNNNECSPETNVLSGNGNVGHKITPIQTEFNKVPSDKRDNLANGTRAIKTEFACMTGTKFQKTKPQKKVKRVVFSNDLSQLEMLHPVDVFYFLYMDIF